MIDYISPLVKVYSQQINQSDQRAFVYRSDYE